MIGKPLPLLCLVLIAAACLANAAGNLPALKADRWVNSAPLTAASIRGRVELIDFWEYTCVNWIRTAPYVKACNREYAPLGLLVVGVHAPEFEFGKRAENIDRGIRDHRLTYPTAIDNDFAMWRAFGNDGRPAKYLFDNRGRLVRRWIEEGGYDEIEREIRRLLVVAQPGIQLPAVSDEVSTFAKTGQPSYVGTTNETYAGGEVNLVMQPGPSGPAAVSGLLDGKPVGEARGVDVGTDGVARFERSGMIRLVGRAPRRHHVLTLSSSDAGLRAYVFTFGL